MEATGATLRTVSSPEPEAVSFEGRTVDEDTFMGILEETTDALDRASIPYAVIGGLASAVLGRSRWTHDLDVFVRDQHDAARAIEALGEAGFATERTDEHWLYKGIRNGVLVDVIFKAKGDIYLDEEMIARTKILTFKGRQIRVVPPEDLIVIKAVIHDEQTPRHWYDALGVIAATELDWDYLIRRSGHGARRVLSLLVYAQANDLVVPEHVIRTLFRKVYDV